ncbi:MAG: UDP-N-acetylmuramoyl-L-alanine--D-glutamate ligase [Oscillochloridaceae bacterium]|nr:UDP-N-acetylmuramoyl-L-alanine--D-glutamate ligase [Chloroflexaceae bacterium]MDW8391108.1 UDP-N-acetylmuramoyl-L-alanine--D-glutamate ligase [Oscillochloridaceae bacterium]
MIDLRGKRVLVMGLGVHGGGLGVAQWLLRQGAAITVTDLASPEALAAPLALLNAAAARIGASVTYALGEHRAEDFTSHDLIVANPAVRPDSPWLALARAAGTPVETEMTLFFRACRGPILGVTGTKGKTTTALLLAAMLREDFPDTVAAGNMRVSALAALDNIGPATPVVLELSSFQLERLGAAGLSPPYALVTNLSPDHLNWHGSMEAYAAAKRQIYWHQTADGVVALNGADDASVEYFPPPDPGGRLIQVCAGPAWSGAACRYPRSSRRPAATVVLRDDQVIWDDPDGAFGPPSPPGGEALFARDEVRLPGAHNLANAMMAAALARAFGVAAASLRAALRGFGGVEHRLELVRELDGVRYVNDTTATNPAAALAALETIAPPVVLIAGGADKQLEFAALGAAIARRVRALVLLEGSATPRLLEAVRAAASDPPLIAGPYDDFATAIQTARSLAAPGDTVLLSPGCASFGMFRNEFHRGEEFRRLVGEL